MPCPQCGASNLKRESIYYDEDRQKVITTCPNCGLKNTWTGRRFFK